MDFCGCGEDVALKQMFEEEEEATFSTAEGKRTDAAFYTPVARRSGASKTASVENRQEDIVVETVESDGTMERQTVFDPRGRDVPEPLETMPEEEATKDETKKDGKKMFKLPKLSKRRSSKK